MTDDVYDDDDFDEDFDDILEDGDDENLPSNTTEQSVPASTSAEPTGSQKVDDMLSDFDALLANFKNANAAREATIPEAPTLAPKENELAKLVVSASQPARAGRRAGPSIGDPFAKPASALNDPFAKPSAGLNNPFSKPPAALGDPFATKQQPSSSSVNDPFTKATASSNLAAPQKQGASFANLLGSAPAADDPTLARASARPMPSTLGGAMSVASDPAGELPLSGPCTTVFVLLGATANACTAHPTRSTLSTCRATRACRCWHLFSQNQGGARCSAACHRSPSTSWRRRASGGPASSGCQCAGVRESQVHVVHAQSPCGRLARGTAYHRYRHRYRCCGRLAATYIHTPPCPHLSWHRPLLTTHTCSYPG